MSSPRETRDEKIRYLTLHFLRLLKHYDACRDTYDPATLLDLSHVLRIWTEVGPSLPGILPAFSASLGFRLSQMPKPMRRALINRPFIYWAAPGGTLVYPQQGLELGVTERVAERFSISVRATKIEGGGYRLSRFLMHSYDGHDDINKASLKDSDSRPCTFVQWLGAASIHLAFNGGNGVLTNMSISNGNFIKRVANSLEGSHSSIAGDSTNQIDRPIKEMLTFLLNGQPLPYFILLKAAQDIISAGRKHLPV